MRFAARLRRCWQGRIVAPTRAWLSSMDVTATLKITQRLASEDSDARQRTELVSFHLEEDPAAAVTSAFRKKQAGDRRRAKLLFNAARKAQRATALIVGSQKVNALTEIFIADSFGAQPFKASPRKALPFFVSYRHTDPPTPESCFGGHGKPKGLRGSSSPGIYYRDARGAWALAPWESDKASAGLIVVSHDETRDSLEVILFGFCAHGTRLLADIFCENPDKFWPEEEEGRKRFGVFVCPLQFEGDEMLELEGWEVIPLPRNVLPVAVGA